MFERELTIYRFLAGYEKIVLADLPEEQFNQPPFPGGNPPSWIIGHLALSSDFVMMVLDKPRLCPKSWNVLFGPGSDPRKHLDKHPGKTELVAALAAGKDAVFREVPGANPELLNKVNPFEPLRPYLPTAADLITHLLTSHESFHLSQLSACRRSAGFAPVF